MVSRHAAQDTNQTKHQSITGIIAIFCDFVNEYLPKINQIELTKSMPLKPAPDRPLGPAREFDS